MGEGRMPASPTVTNCISGNCRGLGRPRAVRALKDLIRSYKPALLGLIETKLTTKEWDCLRSKLGYNYCFAVGSKGRAGGLALLWNSDTDVTLKSYSFYHIEVEVKYVRSFRATLFYGNPRVQLRENSWNLLRKLRDVCREPWIVFGDFNEVLYSWEMNGGMKRNQLQMRQFRDVILDCELRDMGCKGDQFSFSNKRSGDRETKVRLDRAVANPEWRNLFPDSVVTLGFENTSDHKPLIIQLDRAPLKGRLQKNFKFEPMWLRDDEFKTFVNTTWETSGDVPSLTEKLRLCASTLQQWNKEEFGNVQHRIRTLKEKI